MDNVYRREVIKRKTSRMVGERRFSFKTFILKQCMVCAVILTVTCYIAVSEKENMVFPKNTIKYILSHNNEITNFPKMVKEFADNYVFNKKTKDEGKKALIDMVMPVEGSIESPFGMRMHPTEKIEKFHYGIDLGAAEGSKVLCAQKGTAKDVSENESYGKYIIVDHGDGISTLYAHLSSVLANVGDEIDAGQMIAKSGSTGNVTGPHLHFEIRDGDQWLDPSEFITFNKSREEND